MSNWSYSQQSSPGFIYFNNSDPNGDYIPFNNTPPQQQYNVGPQNFSTPQNYRNRRSYNSHRNWNQQQRSSYGRNNRFFSSPNANNSRGNEAGPPPPQFDNSYLIKMKFVHKSFLENPWEELEKKWRESTKSKENETGSSSSPSQASTSGQKRSIELVD